MSKKIQSIYQYFSCYTKEEVDSVIAVLSDKEKKLLYSRYGSNLENPITADNWTTQMEQRFYANLIPKMKQILKEATSKRMDRPNGKGKPLKTIYQQFIGYTKDEVNEALTNLTEEERLLVMEKFGENLDNPVASPYFSKIKSNKYYGEIIPKISQILQEINPNVKSVTKRKKMQTIYQYFKDFTKEEINNVLEQLNDKDKALIRKRYGEDLDNPITNSVWSKKDNNAYYASLIPKIKRRLLAQREINTNMKKERNQTENTKEGAIMSRGKKLQSIYEYLSDCTREEINAAIETLTEEEKEILHMRYGSDLDNPVSQGEFPSKIRDKFYKRIIPKIKATIKGPTDEKKETKRRKTRLGKKSIYEVLRDYSHEEVDAVIRGLSDNEKMMITRRYGADLDNPTPAEDISQEELQQFRTSLLQKIKRKLEKNRKASNAPAQSSIEERLVLTQTESEVKVTDEAPVTGRNIQKEVYMDILTSLTNIPFSKMLEQLSISEAIIFALKIGGAKKYFTDSEIAEFFAISEEDVRETTKKGLMVYQDSFVEFIDTAISAVSDGMPKQEPVNQFVKTLSDKPKL